MQAHLHLARAPSDADLAISVPSPIRVVLADDHALVRHSLRVLLDGEEGVEVIAETGDMPSALHHVRSQKPHVLVLDLPMPDGSGSGTIGKLRQQAAETQVVAVTMHDSPVFAQHVLACGAVGFVLKELADGELLDAIAAAARGEEYVSPVVAPRLEALRRSHTDQELTGREVEILRLIALGHTSVEIASKLSISPRTVESHRARIHNKLGLVTRAELVSYALGRDLLRT